MESCTPTLTNATPFALWKTICSGATGKITIFSITELPTNKKTFFGFLVAFSGLVWLDSGLRWLGVARQWPSVARSGMLAWSEGCQESRQCCASVDGVRRMTIAWLGFSLLVLKTRSTSFILTHTAVLFFRPVSFLLNQGSTFAYHVVALCALAHKMSRENWQHKTNLPISASERSISKCKPIMWCATRSSTGFPDVEASGPVVIRG